MRSGRLSAREVLDAHLAQIERVNPRVNAIVTLVADRAHEAARAADKRQAHGEPLGPLHGLPVAHKDTHLTAGIRTTFGSPTLRDFVPSEDDLVVQRLRAAEVVTIGKTNVPEFAAGSHTVNPVFGVTRNPYDLAKSAGGSSGGAAAALACGMQPVADGSDMGGSLRNPAAFCNVVGLRPSPGRVPTYPAPLGWATMSVQGPMARSVGDVALTLSVLAGPDPRSPIALSEPGEVFAESLGRDLRGLRVAWSPTFGGALPVDPVVVDALSPQVEVFARRGCVVEEAGPDLREAEEVFRTLRAWQFAEGLGPVLDRHPGLLKDAIVWNIEQGRRLSGADLARAEVLHTSLFHRMRRFFASYDVLLTPVTQVPAFDADLEWPTEVAGVAQETYLDWMRSCYWISATGCPALSVPASFTSDGLPVGLQVVGPHRGELLVLQVGHAFEQATGVGQRRPPVSGQPGLT
ncbi:MAG: amidase [Actinomycetota bacterium]|nr:amidase [Actinomycetota bacterium]